MKKKKKNLGPATKADVEEIVTKNIDNFAAIMKRSFDDVYQSFDDVYQRFDGIEGQLTKVLTKAEFDPFKKETERSFYYLQTDVTDLKSKMTKVESRLERVEGGLGSIEGVLKPIAIQLSNHENRIIQLEGNVARF